MEAGIGVRGGAMLDLWTDVGGGADVEGGMALQVRAGVGVMVVFEVSGAGVLKLVVRWC